MEHDKENNHQPPTESHHWGGSHHDVGASPACQHSDDTHTSSGPQWPEWGERVEAEGAGRAARWGAVVNMASPVLGHEGKD